MTNLTEDLDRAQQSLLGIISQFMHEGYDKLLCIFLVQQIQPKQPENTPCIVALVHVHIQQLVRLSISVVLHQTRAYAHFLAGIICSDAVMAAALSGYTY